jgi:hypothetical protein
LEYHTIRPILKKRIRGLSEPFGYFINEVFRYDSPQERVSHLPNNDVPVTPHSRRYRSCPFSYPKSPTEVKGKDRPDGRSFTNYGFWMFRIGMNIHDRAVALLETGDPFGVTSDTPGAG